MTTSKSHFEQLLCKIYTNNFYKNNQTMCIDCLKPRSNKNKFECKNCGCTELYVLDFQNYSCEILTAYNVQNCSIVKY